MLTVSSCLWSANKHTLPFSRCYDETWAVRLYHGWRRNLTRPFRFVVFVDRLRDFPPGIEQELLLSPGAEGAIYGCFNEPYRLGVPTILTGLDTVIVGNCDHFADYCLTADRIALCHDPSPKHRDRSINGVQFIPAGWRRVYDEWVADGARANDMEWLRRYPWRVINTTWPGQVSSYKCDNVRGLGLRQERIVYMHGVPKADQLTHLPWIRKHWLGQ